MQRLFRLSLLVVLLCLLSVTAGFALGTQYESGKVDPGSVRVFVKDTIYIIDNQYVIAGTLLIEPGTTVKFNPQGRLVVPAGGRVIADGLAQATYNSNPDGIDPIGTPYGSTNPQGFSGYADLNYFLYHGSQKTINVSTKSDATIHHDKYDYIFNVILDKSKRKIVDLQYPGQEGYPSDPNQVIIPFESAIMFMAARLEIDPNSDINLNIRPWQRLNYGSPNVATSTIHFVGQPINNISLEWGHIVILPGARAAFFRNSVFENFVKDTTVDRKDYYSLADLPSLTATEVAKLNNTMRLLTNGSGGAMTTFSTRTWLLGCQFNSNVARYNGGALQILQAPAGFPMANIENLGYYAPDKNPNITNPDGTISSVITNNPIPAIDRIDESGSVEPLSDMDRQAYDDARLAVYLGRMRNLSFDHNKVSLANIIFYNVGGTYMVKRDLDNPADYPQEYGNKAFGGAIYIAGREGSEDRKIEIGLGINNSVKVDGQEVAFSDLDQFSATANNAENYQAGASTLGARGGAVYAGRYTSLISAGEFSHNKTYTKFLQDPSNGTNSGFYSMGGALFGENTLARLQVRGGPKRDDINNPTRFYQNESGAGGAIFADGNSDPEMSPIIGGTDFSANTRDYGFNILFQENNAITFGGAILAKRNFTINGAGGVMGTELIGYDDKYRVRFLNNTAGYAGGAIDIDLPNADQLPVEQRAVKMIRTLFRGNIVGQGIIDQNKPEIRGGGAVYALNADLNVVKAVEFNSNQVFNGNGGALAIVSPQSTFKRFFLSDLDMVSYNNNGLATDYQSYDDVFSYENLANQKFPADARMLTRFLDNTITVDDAVLASQSGSGTTQVGKGTLVTPSNLYGTYWLDNNTGYAVGFNGVIVKFENGGSKWTYQNSGTKFRLNKVFFVNNLVGFAAGDRGTIVKTVNGGTTWTMLNTMTDKQINDINFVGNNVGYAVTNEGYVLKTVDGGLNWTVSRPQINNLNSVFFTSVNTGYAAGDRGLIIKTIDGGNNWDVQFVPGPAIDLSNITFTDVNNGFIVGKAGTFIKTTNAGASWQRLASGSTQDLNSTYFTDQNTGYVVGTFGAILKTVDGGANWTPQTSNTQNSLFDVYFPSASVGFASGVFGTMLGTSDAGANWRVILPADLSNIDVVRYHPDIRLPENGVGLGGGIYILDSITTNRLNRVDSIKFNRVRIQGNKSYTGAAVYSDNYDLKLIFNRSLITLNDASSDIGLSQNAITGPVIRDNQKNIQYNKASSDLAGAVIYGEIQGPLPSTIFSEAANSVFDNKARFLIRLPDAPNSKGVLAGTTGIGFGGTDTLRGNYWGKTEANLDMIIANNQGSQYDNATFSTFFVDQDGETHLRFLYTATTDPRNQGPFESAGVYNYTPVPLANDAANQDTPAATSIPEKLLMSGKVYDIYDKGTDIKTADYSKRRMAPIEDFAVGIAPIIRRYDSVIYSNLPSYHKYVKRWTRDPFIADSMINNNPVYPFLSVLQDEFRPNANGEYYHPIGYPVYLEAKANYDGLAERSNFDTHQLDETVFFVINETTGDFIRVNLKQVSKDAPYREVFRTRVELVPDSTNRNPNSLIRRTAEGLLNLGSQDYLLRNLEDSASNEDRATLQGRRYSANTNLLGRVPDLFSNRPTMPADNQGTATFYAGERYHALPVDTGDVVRIISRTVLWREGPIAAYDDGISFRVVRSTLPPVFTGDIVKLSTDTIVRIIPSEYPGKIQDTLRLVEYLNTIFVTEDREYPWSDALTVPQYSTLPLDGGQGRDSIMTITAMDTNKYYDPRSYVDPDHYSRLTYTWIPINPATKQYDPNSGLVRWLMVDSIKAGNTNVINPKDEAQGFFSFRGRPMNPYVVPGGEYVKITAANYPPYYRTIDSLKKLNPPMLADSIAKFANIFSPYFHAMKYDSLNARYAQQDTINDGKQYKTDDYIFRIFVVDSAPKFLEYGSAREEVKARLSSNPLDTVTYIEYLPTDIKCGYAQDGVRLVANLTDSLRFVADFNTDDEMEDQAAVKWDTRFNRTPWDFRYGKTAYGFMNLAIRYGDPSTADTAVIDSTIYDGQMRGRDDDTVITQSRPSWMANQYLHKYDNSDVDLFGIDLTTNGQINIRIPKADAEKLLKPVNQYNGAMNLDTLFTLVVNDGHGGMTFKTVPVLINVAPVITTETLPNAKEDIDYNPELVDSVKMIKQFDPNFGQTHKFELIYVDDTRPSIPKDPCYPEAGVWDISTMHTTPKWLQINERSGILYGTPGVKDAQRQEMVTVLVTDEDGLTYVKQIPLTVDSTNHNPRIFATPQVRCIDKNKKYTDTLLVKDHDLMRGRVAGDPTETLTIRVVQPSGVSARFVNTGKTTISGILANDTTKVEVYSDAFNAPRDQDGKVTIVIEVKDASGSVYQLTYRLQMSDDTDFLCDVKVENKYGASQVLTFGTAPRNASVGDGNDGNPRGMLDSNLCEYELPPLPPLDVFDARWTIPTRTGTKRDIFPQGVPNRNEVHDYTAMFQAGGVIGQVSEAYPVKISWNKNDIPDKNDATKNPSGASWWIRDGNTIGGYFSIYMKTGLGTMRPTITVDNQTDGTCTITVGDNVVTSFVITHDWTSDVPETPAGYPTEAKIYSVSPNPLSAGQAEVEFALPTTGQIRIDVIDALGNVVANIANGTFQAGYSKLYWNGRDSAGQELASGTYTCRLSAGRSTSAYPMVIIK